MYANKMNIKFKNAIDFWEVDPKLEKHCSAYAKLEHEIILLPLGI